MPDSSTPKPRPIPSPKGTRDLYPDDLLRQRYITEAWRRVSIRHGFDEIAGPTFEMRELYTRKSGEGIVSELFSFRREGGDDDYALRPEFTPTLARMYAAKAASLPSPTKWFTAGPYFRAERPQRGRLREFLQWNCDVIGDGTARADAAVIEVLLACVREFGAPYDDSGFTGLGIVLGDRPAVERSLAFTGISSANVEPAISLLDRMHKIDGAVFQAECKRLGLDDVAFRTTVRALQDALSSLLDGEPLATVQQQYGAAVAINADWDRYIEYASALRASQTAELVNFDFLNVVRGLAYYTGTVFELIADGERAVAGGGRYDNLIELFGGPPTPAVGFGMGDVVLGLLLEDKNLMPTGPELREALSQPPASLRPEAFVIADEDQADLVEPLLASLRRGVESADRDASKPWSRDRYDIRPLHARRSYKPKRKKQIQDAANQLALFTVTINEPDKVELKSMDARQDLTPVDVPGLPEDVQKSFADFSVDPASPVYVGRAIANLLG